MPQMREGMGSTEAESEAMSALQIGFMEND
jgi:hypothetical protein